LTSRGGLCRREATTSLLRFLCGSSANSVVSFSRSLTPSEPQTNAMVMHCRFKYRWLYEARESRFNPIQRTFLRSKHWEIFLFWIAVKWFLRVRINTLLGNPLFSSPHASDIFIVRLLHQSDDIVLYAWAYFTGSFFNSISPARCRVSSTGFFLALACWHSTSCLDPGAPPGWPFL
jgi:hypothetical protein